MTFPTITKATQENYYHIQRIELDPTTSLYAHQLSLTPEEELQVKVTNLYSVAFSKGYACGEQQYIEEKERPDLDDLLKKIKHKKEREMGVFPELPLVAPGKGGKKKRKLTKKGKKKTRKTKKNNKRKTKKSKRKTRK